MLAIRRQDGALYCLSGLKGNSGRIRRMIPSIAAQPGKAP
jgi:hypothetical protein